MTVQRNIHYDENKLLKMKILIMKHNYIKQKYMINCI